MTVASLDELKKSNAERIFWYWKPCKLCCLEKMLKEAGYTEQTTNESCSYKKFLVDDQEFFYSIKNVTLCFVW